MSVITAPGLAEPLAQQTLNAPLRLVCQVSSVRGLLGFFFFFLGFFLVVHRRPISHASFPHVQPCPPFQRESRTPGGKGDECPRAAPRTAWLGVRGEAEQALGSGKCRTGCDPLPSHKTSHSGDEADGSGQGLKRSSGKSQKWVTKALLWGLRGLLDCDVSTCRTTDVFWAPPLGMAEPDCRASLPCAPALYYGRTWNRTAGPHCLGRAETPS